MPGFIDRVGGAPISWGVCEVPGWGLQLPPERVLGEAAELGITAFEQGALGWLPTDPSAQRAVLEHYGMTLIGGFVPMVLHDVSRHAEMSARADAVAGAMAACGGRFFVTAVVADLDEWTRPTLGEADWDTLLDGLGMVDEVVARHGIRQVVHPHVDTLVQEADEVRHVLDGSRTSVCLDTGHLVLGGDDPVRIGREHVDRIGLVHLKDIEPSVAERLANGELDLMGAAQAGLFPSLGDGCVPIAEVIETLLAGGYDGWFVIEQDMAITDPDGAINARPAAAVARSLDYLRTVEAQLVGS